MSEAQAFTQGVGIVVLVGDQARDGASGIQKRLGHGDVGVISAVS